MRQRYATSNHYSCCSKAVESKSTGQLWGTRISSSIAKSGQAKVHARSSDYILQIRLAPTALQDVDAPGRPDPDEDADDPGEGVHRLGGFCWV